MIKKIIEKLRLFIVLICAVVLLKTGVSYFDQLFGQINFMIIEPFYGVELLPSFISYKDRISYFQETYESILFSFSLLTLLALFLSQWFKNKEKKINKFNLALLLLSIISIVVWWRGGFFYMNTYIKEVQESANIFPIEENSIRFFWNFHAANKILIFLFIWYPFVVVSILYFILSSEIRMQHKLFYFVFLNLYLYWKLFELISGIFEPEALTLLPPSSFAEMLADPDLPPKYKAQILEFGEEEWDLLKQGESSYLHTLRELDEILIRLGLGILCMSGEEEIASPKASSPKIDLEEMPCRTEKKNWEKAMEGLKSSPKISRIMGGHPEERLLANMAKTGIKLAKENPAEKAKKLYDLCMQPFKREKVRKAAENNEYFRREREQNNNDK
jgi:uncharacterized protein with PQ loop repeat